MPGLPEGSEVTSSWEVHGGRSPMPSTSHAAQRGEGHSLGVGAPAGSTCAGPVAVGGTGTRGHRAQVSDFPATVDRGTAEPGGPQGPGDAGQGRLPRRGRLKPRTERGRWRWRENSDARRRASLLEKEQRSTDRASSPPEGRE